MTQAMLTIFIPTFAVLIGILLNRNDYTKLDNRLSSLEGRLDGRMNSLEGRFHSDMMMVVGKLGELESRVAKLETQRH